MSFRTGIGYDAHKLEPGRPLWLGGVNVPFEQGLMSALAIRTYLGIADQSSFRRACYRAGTPLPWHARSSG